MAELQAMRARLSRRRCDWPGGQGPGKSGSVPVCWKALDWKFSIELVASGSSYICASSIAARLEAIAIRFLCIIFTVLMCLLLKGLES